jgi:Flp pilus assembly pilin Flp
MLALIVIVCIATITQVGANANARFNEIATTLR